MGALLQLNKGFNPIKDKRNALQRFEMSDLSYTECIYKLSSKEIFIFKFSPVTSVVQNGTFLFLCLFLVDIVARDFFVFINFLSYLGSMLVIFVCISSCIFWVFRLLSISLNFFVHVFTRSEKIYILCLYCNNN